MQLLTFVTCPGLCHDTAGPPKTVRHSLKGLHSESDAPLMSPKSSQASIESNRQGHVEQVSTAAVIEDHGAL